MNDYAHLQLHEATIRGARSTHRTRPRRSAVPARFLAAVTRGTASTTGAPSPAAGRVA